MKTDLSSDLPTMFTTLAVLLAVAVTAGLVIGPRMFVCIGETKVDIAKITEQKFVHEGYPQWQQVHGAGCPQSLEELAPYMDKKDTHDPWGSPYLMTCTWAGMVVHSRGEDRVAFNADDIWSNE